MKSLSGSDKLDGRNESKLGGEIVCWKIGGCLGWFIGGFKCDGDFVVGCSFFSF